MSAFGGKADGDQRPSERPLIARSGHSPPSGVDTNVHFELVIEFDPQVYIHFSRKKDAAGGEPATRVKEVTGAERWSARRRMNSLVREDELWAKSVFF